MRYDRYDRYDRWKPHVPAAKRRAQAAREAAKLAKKGTPVSPVIIDGRVIAKTFWGKAWCDNLERYSDYSNRLPRGRTYVRNGSVVDLRIEPGAVAGLVSGSSIYKIEVKVAAVPFKCSCPDWASMCKHVAAVLYGIGARLDEKPDLLFTLRQVNHQDLIAHAGKGPSPAKKRPTAAKVLDTGDLSEIFGIEIAQASAPQHTVRVNPAAGGGAKSNEPDESSKSVKSADSSRKGSRRAG